MSASGARNTLLVLAMAVVIVSAGCTKGSGQAASGSPETNAPMVIVPNVSVGEVHAGMRKEMNIDYEGKVE